jgi:hypothetical protein
MPVRFQIVVDVHDPVREATFWAEALGYVPEPPPKGFATWAEYWTRMGVPEADRFEGFDSIADPEGVGPRIWFHLVPESKTCKNRLHFDIRVSGGLGVPMPTRRDRVEAEAERLVRLGATRLETLEEEGVEWYAVAMADPEGNEFDIN